MTVFEVKKLMYVVDTSFTESQECCDVLNPGWDVLNQSPHPEL